MFFQFSRMFYAATIVCAVTVAPLVATAETQASPTPKAATVGSSVSNVRVASSGLNLLNAGPSRGTQTRRKRVAVGNGSYICSPAGFGQRSRCYSN